MPSYLLPPGRLWCIYRKAKHSARLVLHYKWHRLSYPLGLQDILPYWEPQMGTYPHTACNECIDDHPIQDPRGDSLLIISSQSVSWARTQGWGSYYWLQKFQGQREKQHACGKRRRWDSPKAPWCSHIHLSVRRWTDILYPLGNLQCDTNIDPVKCWLYCIAHGSISTEKSPIPGEG